MSRRLKNYAVSADAIKSADCGKYSDMRIALYFLRGMQRLGRLTDEDATSLDKIDHPMNQDIVVFRIIDQRHREIAGGSMIETDLLDDADAVQVLNEGRPDGIQIAKGKLIV